MSIWVCAFDGSLNTSSLLDYASIEAGGGTLEKLAEMVNRNIQKTNLRDPIDFGKSCCRVACEGFALDRTQSDKGVLLSFCSHVAADVRFRL